MQNSGSARQTAESPAQNAGAVTPHDSNDIAAYIPKGIYVGGGGVVVMVMYGNDAEVTLTGVPAGTFLPVAPRVIKATGTTATNIVAFW